MKVHYTRKAILTKKQKKQKNRAEMKVHYTRKAILTKKQKKTKKQSGDEGALHAQGYPYKKQKKQKKTERGEMKVHYTRKAILTFQHVKGADVLIMGMYVQQFGTDSSPLHQVLLMCC
jgi:hypothetical protein